MSIDIINTLSIKGNKAIYSENRYPVKEETILELKGEFRSSGKIKSKIYFGLRCFKENGEEISAPQVNRIDEPLFITSINTDGKNFTVNKKPEKWNNSNDDSSLRYSKYLGLYYDGNINHLPDYLIKSPAYTHFEDNNIYLNQEIPKDIVDKINLFKTRVMNHYGSSIYDYSAALNEEVPCEVWKEFKATYKGFSNGYGDIKGKFRPETKFVNPVVLCNYSQNEDAILEIKNVKVTVIDKPKFI